MKEMLFSVCLTKIEPILFHYCYGKMVTALYVPYYGIRHKCRNAVKLATLQFAILLGSIPVLSV